MPLERLDNMIRIAVIGHTNAGKTSLLRTLTRDREFGVVSIHPATTRNVEAVRVDLTSELAIEFHDTPGFEDSIGLLNSLHELYPDPRIPGPQRLAEFLNSEAARTEFVQESKALRQLLSCDLSLYVADASEAVSGKYADEFVILNWSGKPCLVVLNFVAGAANPAAWREALHNAGLHNVVEFDTVVFNIRDEQRLLQQTALLLPASEQHIEQLLIMRGEERVRQLEAAAVLIAETLTECALIHAGGTNSVPLVQEQVRQREQRLNRDLLTLFRFSVGDYAPVELPIQGAQWSLDLFDREVWADLGISLGGSAAKGAAAGAAIDLLTGFTSLGLATMIGGVIGAGIDGANRIQQYFSSQPDATGTTQVAIESLCYLARRACLLVRDLARRGHAAMQPLSSQKHLADRLVDEQHLVAILQKSRYQPRWASARDDSKTARHIQELTAILHMNLPHE